MSTLVKKIPFHSRALALTLLVVVVALLPGAHDSKAGASDEQESNVQRLIDQARSKGTVRVILRLAVDTRPEGELSASMMCWTNGTTSTTRSNACSGS